MADVSDELVKAGRIAFRTEGEWWKAYYALPDTMEGALELGQVKLAAVQDPELKNAFIAFMRDVVTVIFRGATGITIPKWNEPEPAPEHERGGSA